MQSPLLQPKHVSVVDQLYATLRAAIIDNALSRVPGFPRPTWLNNTGSAVSPCVRLLSSSPMKDCWRFGPSGHLRRKNFTTGCNGCALCARSG